MSIVVEFRRGTRTHLHMLEHESAYKRNRENKNDYDFGNTQAAILMGVAAVGVMLVLRTRQ